jgi:hypothetical protein
MTHKFDSGYGTEPSATSVANILTRRSIRYPTFAPSGVQFFIEGGWTAQRGCWCWGRIPPSTRPLQSSSGGQIPGSGCAYGSLATVDDGRALTIFGGGMTQFLVSDKFPQTGEIYKYIF